MKLAFIRLTTAEVELEVPEVCPHCGVDFRQLGTLQDDGWLRCQDVCRIVDGPDGPYLDDYDDPQDLSDQRLSTGLSCARCQKVLVTTEAGDGNGVLDA